VTDTIFSITAVLLLVACTSSPKSPDDAQDSMGGSAGAETTANAATGVEPGPVDIEGVFNARQVGALQAGSATLKDQTLIRSGDLHDLTDAGCAALDTLSVKTIIDLRDDPDLSSRPDRDCGNPERSTVLVSLPKLLPPNLDNYNLTLDAIEPKLPDLFSALGRADGPALIHCVIGRDRATLVTSLVLLALGVNDEAVLANASSNQDASITVDAAWFAGAIDRIHAAGGIDPYLEERGVLAADLQALRAAMTQ